MEDKTLHAIVREAEEDLLSGTTHLGEYVDFDLHKTLETIFAYLNSRFINGATDALEREKPFFNIVTAAVNIWYRATDLDRKDVVILPNNTSNVVPAFLATIRLQDWMKRNKFGVFLNSWGRTLAQYGSAVVKFVDRGDELIPTVVPWSRLIVDAVSFDALPVIEKFYKTPAQLRNMANPSHPDYAGYNMEVVKELCSAVQSRKTVRGQQKDNKSDFIELYEVHGLLSRAVYKQAKGEKVTDEDHDTFFQQMHVVSWTKNETDDNYKDVTLYCGKEKQNPYMITHLIEEDGRTLSIGAVEYLFDAQWMANHTMKAWKDQLDLASKLIFQTADANFVGKNVLSNLQTGDILIHSDNKPVTQFPNAGHDVSNLQSFLSQWQNLGREMTATPEAARGTNPPSGQPLGTTQLLAAQSLSLFEVMTENKGMALEVMLREYIIPFIKNGLNNKDEVMSILDDHNLKEIDQMYVPRAAIKRFNQRTKELMLAGKLDQIQPFDQMGEESAVKNDLSQLGNKRPLAPGDVTWSEAFKDLEWEVDVQITSEAIDKQAVLTTLSTMLQTIASNPAILQDPNAKLLFNKTLLQTGVVSPIELSTPSPIQPPQVAGAEELLGKAQ